MVVATEHRLQHAIHHLGGALTKEAMIYLPGLVGNINTGYTY